MRTGKTARTAIVPAALILFAFLASASAAADRPPQFVLISFDNCTELERWRELFEFQEEMDKQSIRVRFTFFVSGANLLANRNGRAYQGPHQARGASNIGFGGSVEDVERRVQSINRMRAGGHEIGSHAVGHFDGRNWSEANWLSEFQSYNDLFANVASNNELPATAGFAFPPAEIVGFRAPYLARGGGLHAALRQNRFRYDASGTGEANAWPEMKDGLWRFNLANLRIVGSGRYTLSMDYNFLIAQSGVAGNPKNAALYREQMLQTYLQYFRSSYTGNRAPVHIGHHFFGYQGGVYNEALKTFARMVCGLPEVRCVTNAELADFLDRLDSSTLRAYQGGDFPRASDRSIDPARASER